MSSWLSVQVIENDSFKPQSVSLSAQWNGIKISRSRLSSALLGKCADLRGICWTVDKSGQTVCCKNHGCWRQIEPEV